MHEGNSSLKSFMVCVDDDLREREASTHVLKRGEAWDILARETRNVMFTWTPLTATPTFERSYIRMYHDHRHLYSNSATLAPQGMPISGLRDLGDWYKSWDRDKSNIVARAGTFTHGIL